MIVHCQRPVAREREQCQCHIFNIYWPVYRWEINRFILLSSLHSPRKIEPRKLVYVCFHLLFSSFVARWNRPQNQIQHIFARMLCDIVHHIDPRQIHWIIHSSWKLSPSIPMLFTTLFLNTHTHIHDTITVLLTIFYLFAFGYTLSVHFINSLFLFWFRSFPPFDWAVEPFPEKWNYQVQCV